MYIGRGEKRSGRGIWCHFAIRMYGNAQAIKREDRSAGPLFLYCSSALGADVAIIFAAPVENVFVRHGSILKSPEKACKINDFTKRKGTYYTTITPFLKEP